MASLKWNCCFNISKRYNDILNEVTFKQFEGVFFFFAWYKTDVEKLLFLFLSWLPVKTIIHPSTSQQLSGYISLLTCKGFISGLTERDSLSFFSILSFQYFCNTVNITGFVIVKWRILYEKNTAPLSRSGAIWSQKRWCTNVKYGIIDETPSRHYWNYAWNNLKKISSQLKCYLSYMLLLMK